MTFTHRIPPRVHCRQGILLALFLAAASAGAGEVLRLHPENPHYFLFRGRPTVIITSGEHYGAVLNLDFDDARYLRALERNGLNGTRTFVGAYCEAAGNFSIAQNTLAPKAGRFLCPWARSAEPGYENGGNKFDLTRWDDAYFRRLRDFVGMAGRRGVVVEVNLFCPFYEESMWRLSPMNSSNNVNGLGAVARTNVYALGRNGGLQAVQDALVRKVAAELNRFDNLYYEVCNEPYFGGVTPEWQDHIVEVVTCTEKGLGRRHLISQNIANQKAKVLNPNPAVSILNFHYASPPDTVALNYGLDRVIGDNETGFRGTGDATYRMEAWDFITAGGGLFNNLDYSFTIGHEDGSFVVPPSQPGGGSPALRRQLGFLAGFIYRFDFVHMRPDSAVVVGGMPEGFTARVLAKRAQDYMIYLRAAQAKPASASNSHEAAGGRLALRLALPRGSYTAEWFDTRRGKPCGKETITSSDGPSSLSVPAFEEDIALAIHRR